MNRITRVESTIRGSYSGNEGNNNVYGSKNTIRNTYVMQYMTGDGVGDRREVFGAGDGGLGPYRLIPYARNSTFTGRKNLLELVKTFSEQTAHNRIALHGLGGSGKTQIALEYVYRRVSMSDCHVFWVQGSGVSKFSQGFKDVARHARILLASATTDETEYLLCIKRWFEDASSGDWILVIDNADDDRDFAGNSSPVAKFIPQGNTGTVIFTTRSRLVASRQGCKIIEVGKMEEEDAQELFSKRFGGGFSLEGEEKTAVRMILAAVHHLPLAIIGAAAFMTETKSPPSAYWTILQESDERAKRLLSQQFCDIQRAVDEPESVLGTYFVTFNRIVKRMPSAARLLRLIAFLDRQNIPEELLSQCGLEGMDDPIEFRRAIGSLLGFSLVEIVICEGKRFYELHRLVQLSLQAYLPTKELSRGRAAALSTVSRLFPRGESERRHAGPVYIQHALAVTKDSTDPTAEDLCFRMGQYFRDQGSYNSAEIQFRRCIALRGKGKEYDWDDETQGRFVHQGVASAYRGKSNITEKIFQTFLGGLKGSFRTNSPDMLKYIEFLALVLKSQGKYDEAETMNRHTLELHMRVLGPDHPSTLTCLSDLAAVLRYQGKYDESETMNRSALEGYENILGLQHHNTLTSANNLALVLQDQGKYDESEMMNRRVLEGFETVCGPEHRHTLTSVNNLAVVLRYQGKYDESETMNRRALEGREKFLGPDHPSTLTSVCDLAAVLQYQGKYPESEMMNRRALEGREKILGPDHPSTLTSIGNLALVLQGQGKYDESEAMSRYSLEGREKILGPDHPDTLTSISGLASVLQDQGKYDESEAMSRRALEGREKVLGLDHPCTLASANSLALLLQYRGKCDESEAMNRWAQGGLPGKVDRA